MKLAKLRQTAIKFDSHVTVLFQIPFIARKLLIPVEKLQLISQVYDSPGRGDGQLPVERDKLGGSECEFEELLTGLGLDKNIHTFNPLY